MPKDTETKQSRLTVAVGPSWHDIRVCGKCHARLDADGKCLCNTALKVVAPAPTPNVTTTPASL